MTNPAILSADIPSGWPVCFLHDCPQRQQCLRHHAAFALLPELQVGEAVFPSARTADGCAKFHPIAHVRVAVGFKGIFREVKERDAHAMRMAITRYLGNSSSYYRHRNGSIPLLPEQQAWIADLFRRYGYTEELQFDDYREAYRFEE